MPERRVLIGVDARSLLQKEVRGEGKTLLRLYQTLARLRPDWRIRLYGESAPNALRLGDAFAVRTRQLPGFRWNTWERIALPLMAARDRVDLLHCSSSSAPPIVGRPFVVTVHDLIPLMFDDGQTQAYAQRFELTLASALRRADAVIAVSESTRHDLVLRFGVRPAHVHVIHWGADAVAPPPAAAATSALVLAFGGDAPRKNTTGVLAGFAQASRRVPTARLALVGVSAATRRAEYRALAGRLGIGDKVSFAGYVTEADLQRLWSQAAVLFYPSLYEGFGMPVVEAMARGVPVVASNLTSIPEVVANAGILVDPRDDAAAGEALAKVLGDPALRAQLRARGLERARALSWEDCARKTAAVFERVLA
jgi:glycosyltransferase involved in cell wall biosynthesis